MDTSLSMVDRPPIVLDNGTGYTKMGYAGNHLPSYVIPTAVASDEKAGGAGAARDKLDDLDFHIGDEVRVWGTLPRPVVCCVWARARAQSLPLGLLLGV